MARVIKQEQSSSRVTMKDIATRAGVSRSTVSFVLNEGETPHANVGVSQATRELVLQTARDLGYRPNAAARSVREGRFYSIALLLSSVRYRSFLSEDRLEAIHDALEAQGQHLIVSRMDDERLTDAQFVPTLLKQLVCDGLLINYSAEVPRRLLELIAEYRIPAIWINSRIAPHDSVFPDDWNGAGEATRRLLALGHRRIHFVSPYSAFPATHYSLKDRQQGYIAAMQQAGQDPLLFTCQPELHPHFSLREHLGQPRLARPTALVCYNGEITEAAITAALSLGLAVPEDLSLIAINGTILQTGGQEIATMQIPDHEIGRLAVEKLLEKIAHPEQKCPSVAVPLTFIPGASLAPPAPDTSIVNS